MGKDALIQAYLSLKDRFLEQLTIDAEKDRLIKTLSERLNLNNAKQFGRSTETSVSLSGSHSKNGEDTPARKRLQNQDFSQDAENSLNKERPKRKPGCAQRVQAVEKLGRIFQIETPLRELSAKEPVRIPLRKQPRPTRQIQSIIISSYWRSFLLC